MCKRIPTIIWQGERLTASLVILQTFKFIAFFLATFHATIVVPGAGAEHSHIASVPKFVNLCLV